MSKGRPSHFYHGHYFTGAHSVHENRVDVFFYFTIKGLIPTKLILESPPRLLIKLKQGQAVKNSDKAVLEPERSRKALLEYLESANDDTIPKGTYFVFPEWCDLGDTAHEVYSRIQLLLSLGLKPIPFRQKFIDLSSAPAALMDILEQEMNAKQELKAECKRKGINMFGPGFIEEGWIENIDYTVATDEKLLFELFDKTSERFFELLEIRNAPSPILDAQKGEGKKACSKITNEIEKAIYERRNEPCNFCKIYMSDYAITQGNDYTLLFNHITDFIVEKGMLLSEIYCDYSMNIEARYKQLKVCIEGLNNEKGKHSYELRNHKFFFLFPSWQTLAKNAKDAFRLIQIFRKKNIIPVAVMQKQVVINIYETKKSIQTALKECFAINPEIEVLWEKEVSVSGPGKTSEYPLPKENLLTETIKMTIYQTE